MINTENILKDINIEVKYMYQYISELEQLGYQDMDSIDIEERVSELNELLSGCIKSIHIKITFFLELLGLTNVTKTYIEEIEKSDFTSLRMYDSVDVVDSPVWISMTKYVSLLNYINKNESSEKVFDSLNSNINDIRKLVGSFKHKEGISRGILAEKFVKEFFEMKKYEVKSQNSTKLDHEKIDLIAIKNNQRIYIQVKAGKINDIDIENVVKNVKRLSVNEKEEIVACIVSKKFHHNSQFKRVELEEEFKLKIIYIDMYQIEDLIPQASKALKRTTIKEKTKISEATKKIPIS